MTTDILIDINQKDVMLQDPTKTKTFFTGEYGMHQFGEDTAMYLDIIIPSTYNISPERDDIYARVPYIPAYIPISVRFLRLTGSTYSIIRVFATESFQLYSYKGGDRELVYGSKLIGININGLVRLRCVSASDGCDVFSCDTDFEYGNADKQSVELMMKCSPGKNYRYPVSGIGAQRFIGSIIDRTSAANDMIRELEDDGQSVRDAYYDSDTQRMRVTTDECNNVQKITEIDKSKIDTSDFNYTEEEEEDEGI